MHEDWQQVWLDKYYRSMPGWRDGTTEFIELGLTHINSRSRVLEVGPGHTNRVSQSVGDAGRHLVGVDVGTHMISNEALDARVLYDGKTMPFATNSFDAVISSYVVEHLEQPMVVCAEIARVLRVRGVFIFRTPNLFHYVTIAARLTPHTFHHRIVNWLHQKPEDPDPYPTFYRMNTPVAVRRVLETTGFFIEFLSTVEKEPSYGMSARVLFLLGLLYERLVNSCRWLSMFRSQIVCVARLTALDRGRE